MMNILNGGMHADRTLDFREFIRWLGFSQIFDRNEPLHLFVIARDPTHLHQSPPLHSRNSSRLGSMHFRA